MGKWFKRTKRATKANTTAQAVSYFSGCLVAGAMFTIVGFWFFIHLGSELLKHQLAYFDQITGHWFFSVRAGWLTEVMIGITNLGSTSVIVSAALLLTTLGLSYRRFLLDFLTLDLCVSGALGISELLKAIFHRPRPPLPWLSFASGYSFPSGHTLLTLSLYGFLAYLVLRQKHLSWHNLAAGAGLILLPLMVGISRVYLGVHFPSDVLAGWAVAAAWLGTCITGREILRKSGLNFKRG